MSKNKVTEETKRELSPVNLNITNGSPEHRRETAQRNRGSVEYKTQQLKRERDNVGSEYQERRASHTGRDETQARPSRSHTDAKNAAFCTRQGFFLLLAEVAIAGGVAYLTSKKSLGVLGSVGVGVCVTVVLNLLFHGLVKLGVKVEIPLPSREKLKRWADVLTVVVIGAAAVFLCMRWGGSFKRDIPFTIVTTVTGLALPFLAAVYFELAASFSELNDLAEKYEDYDRALAYAEGVLGNIHGALKGITLGAPVEEADGEVLPENGAQAEPIPTTGALLIAFLILGMASLAARPALACTPMTIKVRPDISGSPDLQAMTIANQKLQAKLLARPCVERIEVSGFATTQEVLSGSVDDLNIPLKKEIDKEKVCGEMGRAAYFWDEDRKEYDDKCNKKLEQVADTELEQLRQRISRIFSKLDFKKVSRQSCIYQAVAWALAEPRTVVPILVTDLKHERCPFPDGPIEPLFGAPPGARPIIIVVPSQGDPDPIAAMDKRMKEVRKRVPTARVIPYTQIETFSMK